MMQLWMNRLRSVSVWLAMLAGIVGVTLLLMAFAGYFHTKVDAKPSTRLRPAPDGARYAVVTEITQPRYESAIGAIKPVHEANVASKILARVLEVNVTAGKKVTAGEILVKLSDDEQRSRMQQAEANRDSMIAELQLAKSEVARSKQLMACRHDPKFVDILWNQAWRESCLLEFQDRRFRDLDFSEFMVVPTLGSDRNAECPNGTTKMRTLAKTLAVIVAMASLATAQGKAAKPDIVDTASEEAYVKLKGNRAGEEREFELAPGVKMTFCWCPAGEFVMGSPRSEEGRESREDQAKVTLSKGSDPTGPKEGYSRMIRGGDWMRPAVSGKSGFRGCHFPPDTRSNYVGFRVALSSPEVSN